MVVFVFDENSMLKYILKVLKVCRSEQNENFVRDKKMVLLCERVIFIRMSCNPANRGMYLFFLQVRRQETLG